MLVYPRLNRVFSNRTFACREARGSTGPALRRAAPPEFASSRPRWNCRPSEFRQAAICYETIGLASRWARASSVAISLLLLAAPARAADPVDLTGTFSGYYADHARHLKRNNFRIVLRQDGAEISAEATDKTLWITGRVVGDRVELEWRHSSGTLGKGYWEILEGGNRLEGSWKSEGSGRFYGDWDLRRQ